MVELAATGDADRRGVIVSTSTPTSRRPTVAVEIMSTRPLRGRRLVGGRSELGRMPPGALVWRQGSVVHGREVSHGAPAAEVGTPLDAAAEAPGGAGVPDRVFTSERRDLARR